MAFSASSSRPCPRKASARFCIVVAESIVFDADSLQNLSRFFSIFKCIVEFVLQQSACATLVYPAASDGSSSFKVRFFKSEGALIQANCITVFFGSLVDTAKIVHANSHKLILAEWHLFI